MSEVDTGLPPLFDGLLATAYDEPAETSPREIEVPDDDEIPTRTRKPRSDKGKPRGPRGTTGPRGGRSTSDKKLAEDLLNPYAKVIKGIAFAAPTVAAVMSYKGESTMNAVVALATPKMKAALANVARIGPGADLIEFGAMVLVAAGMDFGRIKPGSIVAEATGVQDIWNMVHPDVPEQDQHFGRPPVDHEQAADNVHPFPGTAPMAEYPPVGASMFTSYPGAPAS